MEKIVKHQVLQAVDALLAFIKHQNSEKQKSNYEKKQKEDLFAEVEEDLYVSLQISLNRIPLKEKISPIRIPIPNTIYGTANSKICLFIKDSDLIKKKLLETPIDNISEIIDIKSLKLYYKQFESKRELCKQFDFFIADNRIINLLPSLLGKVFFMKKKTPLPVNLDTKSWPTNLKNARDSTTMYISTGPLLNIRIAKTTFASDQIQENILSALPKIVEHIPGKWKNVQGIYIKTPNSIALPIYNTILIPDIEKEKKEIEKEVNTLREEKLAEEAAFLVSDEDSE